MYDVIEFLQSKGELLTGKAVAKEDIEKIEELSETRLLHRCEWTQRDFSSIATACYDI